MAVTKIACLGDSLTRGFGQSPTPWVDLLQNLLGTTNYDVDNFGVDGATLQDMQTTYTNSIAGQGYKVLVFLGGINNIASVGSPLTAAQMSAIIQNIVTAARAEGMRVLVSTLWPWHGYINWSAPRQTLTTDLNTLISAYSNCEKIDGYSKFGQVGNSTYLNPTYDLSDGLHINGTGAVFWSQQIFLALDLPVDHPGVNVNRIQFRRGATGGLPSTVNPGEPVYDLTTNTLYVGASNGTPTAVGGGSVTPTFTSITTTATSGNTAYQGVTGSLFKFGTGAQEYIDSNSNVLRVGGSSPSSGLQAGTVYTNTLRGISTGELLFQTFSSDGASACPFSFLTANNLTNAGAKLAKFTNNSSDEVFHIRPSGKLGFPTAGNSTGSPGAATLNTPAGRSAIAAAATSVTITNSLVSTSSIVLVTLQTNDATALLKNVVPGSGSFVVNLNAAATGNTNFGWMVIN